MRNLLLAALLLLPVAAPASTPGGVTVLAHRGMAQGFDRTGIDGNTCTAARMTPPSHPFHENTLASMREAFRHGADVVEFDIHPTTDGEFAVFHDWRLECRTNGVGVTRRQTMAYLKTLDIGHGYTADGGATYPFRGKHFGEMPTWKEVMEAFPGRRFLVNVKSNDADEGRKIIDYVERRGIDLAPLMFYGGQNPIAVLREAWPEVRTMSYRNVRSCAAGYFLLGWSGYVPEACRNTLILVPLNYTGLAWGWPGRFVERLRAANTEVYVIGPIGSGSYGSVGIDDLEALQQIPPDYRGGIWTDKIEVIGPAVKR